MKWKFKEDCSVVKFREEVTTQAVGETDLLNGWTATAVVVQDSQEGTWPQESG